MSQRACEREEKGGHSSLSGRRPEWEQWGKGAGRGKRQAEKRQTEASGVVVGGKEELEEGRG